VAGHFPLVAHSNQCLANGSVAHGRILRTLARKRYLLLPESI
jgi:hypothetical protein